MRKRLVSIGPSVINIVFACLVYLVYKYYSNASSHSHSKSQSQHYILLGIGLYILLSIVIVIRAYIQSEQRAGAYSVRGVQVSALGLLGADKLKNITVSFVVSEEEFNTLKSNSKLIVNSGRFQVPIRNGDNLRVELGDSVPIKRLRAVIDQIDGVNMKVSISKIDTFS